MDWITLLRSQQTDFIQRLKSGHLLHCDIEGQHSELTVISGERLTQLRNFCWQMAEKYKRNSPVRDVFINNLKGKLAEEVVKARLGDWVTEVDYEQRLGGDGKVDFTLTSKPEIGIQVKSRHGSIDTVKWSISPTEVDENDVLVCILIQENVNEAQLEYHLILAGFMPINLIDGNNKLVTVGVKELLYGSGLFSYLEFIQYDDTNSGLKNQRFYQNKEINTDLKLAIYMGLWEYNFPAEEVLKLESEIKRIRSQIEGLWQEVILNIESSSLRALLRMHCNLISFDGKVACIGVTSKPLLKFTESKLPNIQAAFKNVWQSDIKVSFKVATPDKY